MWTFDFDGVGSDFEEYKYVKQIFEEQTPFKQQWHHQIPLWFCC